MNLDQALGIVGASSSTAFKYMQEVNTASEALDKDVTAQTKPGAPPNMIGQGFMGAWDDYINGQEDPDNAVGWRAYVANNSSTIDRVLDTEGIIEDIGGYEHRFNELHRAFSSLGGKPSVPELVPGPPLADLSESGEDTLGGAIGKIGTGLFLLGAVAIGAYFVVNSGKL